MADLTKSPGSGVNDGAVVTWTACNNADQEYAFDKDDTLLVRNSGVTGRVFTVYSAPEPHTGRLDNTVETIAAGVTKRYGPLPVNGWRQANGKLKVKGVHAELLTAVIPDGVGHLPEV